MSYFWQKYYLYIYLCLKLFPDQLQMITNEFYIVENHRKVVLNVSLRLLVLMFRHAPNWNGGHLGFVQYGAHGGSPA